MNSIYRLKCLLFIIILFSLLNSSYANSNSRLVYPHTSISLYTAKKGALNFGIGAGEYTSLTQIAYSPFKHLSIIANHINFKNISSVDKASRIGLGTYYFLSLNEKNDKDGNLIKKFAMKTGFLFDAAVSYGRGSKVFSTADNFHEAKFNLFSSEIGIHLFTAMQSFHFTVNRNLMSFKSVSIIGIIPDEIVEIARFLENDKSLAIYTYNLKYTFGTKQARLYFDFNFFNSKIGDIIKVEEALDNSTTNSIAGVGLIFNINSIFKKQLLLPKLKHSND